MKIPDVTHKITQTLHTMPRLIGFLYEEDYLYLLCNVMGDECLFTISYPGGMFLIAVALRRENLVM